MAQLLVVEDDAAIRGALIRALTERGHAVTSQPTAMTAIQHVLDSPPDLILLDLGLPDLGGYEALRMMRAITSVPVVVVTARDDEAEIIRVLDAGADDYVVKPFGAGQIDARIRAVLRRTRGDGSEPPPRLKFADLELDEDSHEVWRGGQQIQLSPTEFKLLRYFMGNANRVLSKMQILDHVWDYDFRGDTGIVESYVSVLRRKVDTTEPHLLHTLRGVGYVLRLPSS